MPSKFLQMPGPSTLHFGIMADGDDELAGGFVVIDAVDHAASAERQTLARVVFGAAGHRIAQVKEPVLGEYQTVGRCFGHARILTCFPSDG